ATFFKCFTKELSNTAFNIIDDFISSFFIGEETAEAFYILLQYVVGRFLNGNHPALEVYVYYLFHELISFLGLGWFGCFLFLWMLGV
ncbi:hypothetical protein CWC16_20080, partial [Pseudoalteromonas sp. S3776]